MAFQILLSKDAKRDIQALRVVDRRKVLDLLEIHLRYEPKKESKSRIKRLRSMETPQYRLRVDDIRIFYDVTENDVEIIAVIHKSAAATWLAREGMPTDDGEAQAKNEEAGNNEDD